MLPKSGNAPVSIMDGTSDSTGSMPFWGLGAGSPDSGMFAVCGRCEATGLLPMIWQARLGPRRNVAHHFAQLSQSQDQKMVAVQPRLCLFNYVMVVKVWAGGGGGNN